MGLKTPDITLYSLQASRSIRIAWLLEELGIEYKLRSWERESSGLAPANFKQSCGALLGRAPVLKDGPLTLQESGAITECADPGRPYLLLTLADKIQQVSLREI